jgi:hypothetical protein
VNVHGTRAFSDSGARLRRLLAGVNGNRWMVERGSRSVEGDFKE